MDQLIYIAALNPIPTGTGRNQPIYEQSQQKLGTFLENKLHTLKIKVFKKFH